MSSRKRDEVVFSARNLVPTSSPKQKDKTPGQQGTSSPRPTSSPSRGQPRPLVPPYKGGTRWDEQAGRDRPRPPIDATPHPHPTTQETPWPAHPEPTPAATASQPPATSSPPSTTNSKTSTSSPTTARSPPPKPPFEAANPT